MHMALVADEPKGDVRYGYGREFNGRSKIKRVACFLPCRFQKIIFQKNELSGGLTPTKSGLLSNTTAVL